MKFLSWSINMVNYFLYLEKNSSDKTIDNWKLRIWQIDVAPTKCNTIQKNKSIQPGNKKYIFEYKKCVKLQQVRERLRTWYVVKTSRRLDQFGPSSRRLSRCTSACELEYYWRLFPSSPLSIGRRNTLRLYSFKWEIWEMVYAWKRSGDHLRHQWNQYRVSLLLLIEYSSLLRSW